MTGIGFYLTDQDHCVVFHRCDHRTSTSTLALEDSALPSSNSQSSTPESGLDVYLVSNFLPFGLFVTTQHC